MIQIDIRDKVKLTRQRLQDFLKCNYGGHWDSTMAGNEEGEEAVNMREKEEKGGVEGFEVDEYA